MPRQKREESGTGICHVMQGKESKTCPYDSHRSKRLQDYTPNYEPHWEEKSPSHNGRGFAALVGTLADGKFPQGSFSFFC